MTGLTKPHPKITITPGQYLDFIIAAHKVDSLADTKSELKQFFIEMVKAIELDTLGLPDPLFAKYFKFGAYDMGREICERIDRL